MWSKIYKHSSIVKKHENCYVLTIKYWWYWLLSYEEVYVFKTVEDAKNKLIECRTHNKYNFDCNDHP